jgi:spermidine synthase
LASYAHPGDYFRFYEIDPAVFGFSLGAKPVFTFLQDSRAQIDIVIGDARVAFEEEAAKRNLQKFDILCLDAFSSDAVPVHLLTAEAMALYLAELRGPDSVIAFHLTNRALDLRPVVRALAHRYHLESVEVSRAGAGDWVLASANGAILRTPGIADHAHAVTGGEDVLWSDEFSNLFQVLKR